MREPSASDIKAARATHECLITTLRELTDSTVRQASLLPGWTVGHVLTHLARQADGNIRIFEAAERGEVAEQYPGGAVVRNADIDAGGGRPTGELVRDVVESCRRLEAAWGAAGEIAWESGTGDALIGPIPVADLVWIRRREVEIHHADLGLAYGFDDWPDDFVDQEFDRLIVDLPDRLATGVVVRLHETDTGITWVVPQGGKHPTSVSAGRRRMLAWLFGRLDEPAWPKLEPGWVRLGRSQRSI